MGDSIKKIVEKMYSSIASQLYNPTSPPTRKERDTIQAEIFTLLAAVKEGLDERKPVTTNLRGGKGVDPKSVEAVQKFHTDQQQLKAQESKLNSFNAEINRRNAEEDAVSA